MVYCPGGTSDVPGGWVLCSGGSVFGCCSSGVALLSGCWVTVLGGIIVSIKKRSAAA